MYEREHPFGPQHPWHDPFEPQDPFDPRPDQDLAIAGPLAPRPESFPLTDEGRREYYAAVRSAAQQQRMLQQQHMQHMQQVEAAEAARAHAVRVAERRRRTALLVLLP